MDIGYAKRVVVIAALTATAAIGLSVLWRIPYIFTFFTAAALVLGGHLVTIDDDLPGGWSNPDGSRPFPMRELVVKIVVVVVLGLAALIPDVRALGR